MELLAVDGANLKDPLGRRRRWVYRIEREGIALSDVLEEDICRGTRGLFGEISGQRPIAMRTVLSTGTVASVGVIEFIRQPRGAVPEILLRMSGLTIGDRLTDNAAPPATATYRRPTPGLYVARAPAGRRLHARCYGLKRKSDPALDEQQDGARAIIIEEAITQRTDL